MKKVSALFLTLLSFFVGLASQVNPSHTLANTIVTETALTDRAVNKGKLIHVVVALCDNQYQGIVPVPAKIGNGDDPANNLYWGAGYGVKTFFKRSPDWKLLATLKPENGLVLERLIFQHRQREVYLVADAYRGRKIKQSTIDFLAFNAGKDSIPITIDSPALKLYAGGSADLIAYIGHDGLMDFTLTNYPAAKDQRKREAIILACISKSYFATPLRQTGAQPLLWTTGLMAPEAYVLSAALTGWVAGEDASAIRKRAAQAYNQYQKCGINAAMRLFATGW